MTNIYEYSNLIFVYVGLLTFETLNKVGDKRQMMIAVIGDLGQTTDSLSTLQHVLGNNDLKVILHVGDLSYADCDQKKWDSYGEMVQVLGSARPWMVGSGNHEIEQMPDYSAQYFLAYEKRYRMPGSKPAEYGSVLYKGGESNGVPWCCPSSFLMEYNYGNSFYSFDFGMVHVINLNPYSSSNSSSVQYNWLLDDLSRVDRSITPWVIVTMHCPWYNSNQAHHDEYQTVLMRANMEQLFYKHHVNLVFAGHVHAYERSYPVFDNQTVADGVTYIVIGDAGNAEGHSTNYYTQPSWSAFRNGTQYGHGELNVYNNTHIEWTWHRNVDGLIVERDTIMVCNSALINTSICNSALLNTPVCLIYILKLFIFLFFYN